MSKFWDLWLPTQNQTTSTSFVALVEDHGFLNRMEVRLYQYLESGWLRDQIKPKKTHKNSEMPLAYVSVQTPCLRRTLILIIIVILGVFSWCQRRWQKTTVNYFWFRFSVTMSRNFTCLSVLSLNVENKRKRSLLQGFSWELGEWYGPLTCFAAKFICEIKTAGPRNLWGSFLLQDSVIGKAQLFKRGFKGDLICHRTFVTLSLWASWMTF